MSTIRKRTLKEKLEKQYPRDYGFKAIDEDSCKNLLRYIRKMRIIKWYCCNVKQTFRYTIRFAVTFKIAYTYNIMNVSNSNR